MKKLQQVKAPKVQEKPDSVAELNETLKKVEGAIGAMSAQDQFGQLKVEAERANAMRSLYVRVREAAAAVAKESNIDYVIINDAIPPIEPAGFAATRQQLAMRRMLFANGEMDITDAVIGKANADFKSRGGKVPPPPAAPVAAPKP